MANDLGLTYLGITLDDRDPQAIVDAAVSQLQTTLPQWVARNGSLEVALLEAIGTAEADLIYALNRIPGVIIEGILTLYGVTRSPGLQGAGSVTVTFDMARSLTVASGQRFTIPGSGIVLAVSADTVVTSATSATVPVVTVSPTDAANGIAVGTALQVTDLIPYVTSAVITTSITGGAAAESDAAYLQRASSIFARVTSSLVLPVHFTAYCLQDPRVGRAVTLDNYKPGDTLGTPDPGHATVFLYGSNGFLDSSVLTQLQTAMQAQAAAMLTIHTAPITILTQPLTVNVHILPGYSYPVVQAAITAALQAWMSPMSWTFGHPVRITEIIPVVAAVAGVDYVQSVTTPTADVTLQPWQVAAAGTITVNAV